ncbi:MAG: thiol peroxidase [Fimbriimonadia bacterium]|nr:thiol peroxidase [Fimbriimonadia bacterium]
MQTERPGAVTFKGHPFTLVGSELKPGDKAPDATLINQNFENVKISDYAGNILILNAVLSVDTGICSAQTKRFEEELANLPDSVKVLTISMDLPFAQKRFCSDAHIEKVEVLSDHRDASFGAAYGTLVKETRWGARALFVIDPNGTIRYAEYVPEIASHPSYDDALSAVRELL